MNTEGESTATSAGLDVSGRVVEQLPPKIYAMFHKRLTGVNQRWRLGFTGAALVWMAFIFYLSSLSQEEANRIASLGDIGSYAAHFVLYAVLAALIVASMWSWKLGYQLRWAVFAAGLAALYGVSDEYHQTFVDGRSATLVDVIVNTVGATFSVAGMRVLVGKLRGRSIVSK